MHMLHIFVKKQNVCKLFQILSCKLFLFRILNMNQIFCLILAGGGSILDPSKKKRGRKTATNASQTSFKYILETRCSDKLSLCVHYCISRRRETVASLRGATGTFVTPSAFYFYYLRVNTAITLSIVSNYVDYY